MAQLNNIHEAPIDAPSATVAASPDLHDRITEAYFGKFGDEFARSTRERIHWICAHASGARVLDVGCSQGIADILLGREGKEVVGIDVASRSIEEARLFLSKESSRVQENVTFINGDFLTADLNGDHFNTVIMSEVLEHLVQPEVFVTAAADRLVDGGRLIITVPFGVNDWPDHKQTFYLQGPWRLVSEHFAVERVRLFGKWIGLVAKKRSAKEGAASGSPPAGILDEAEAVFQQIERGLLNRVDVLSRQLAEVQAIARATKDLQKEVARLNTELSACQSLIEQHRSDAKNLTHLLETARAARLELENDLGAQQKLAERHRVDAENLTHLLEAERTARLELEDALSASKDLMEQHRSAAEKLTHLLEAERVARLSLGKELGEKKRLQSRVQQLQRQKVAAEAKAEGIRDTISFQLGHALIFGFKSWGAFLALPGKLIAIDKESRRRRLEKKDPSAIAQVISREEKSHALSREPLEKITAPPVSKVIESAQAAPVETGTSATQLIDLARSMPISNGCRYYKKIPLKVGIITDIYMFNFYKDVFSEVHYLSPTNYESVLSSTSLDVVLYVSCWKGIADEEWRGVKFREQPARAFDSILEIARQSGAKIVFQSIEDPSNFEYFLPLAKKFDYIFTTDVDTIARYKNECGHERVFYGEYGANPILNNPIGSQRHKLNAAFFAGSWAGRYQERCEDMNTILDSIMSSGGRVIIADRNYGTDSKELRYPDRFQSSLIPPVEHDLLQSMHKLFRYNLNFNSIKNSPTMCAMRVYEMQAMGVGILSNYARSVFNKFPEIRIVPWAQNLQADFEPSSGFEEYRANMAMVRNVLNDRTSFDIAARMMSAVGFGGGLDSAPIIGVIGDPNDAAVRESFDRQKYGARVLVSPAEVSDTKSWEAVAQQNSIGYFTWFTADDEYEQNYLSDLINAFKYTAARYVTHLAWFDGKKFCDGVQHEYTNVIGGKARTLFSAEEFSPVEFVNRQPHESVSGISGGYAIDPFELNYIRYAETLRHAVRVDPELSVIVPVFNNGRFLKSKCIASLQRNRMWPKLEVLLVDDGSTDPETLSVVKALSREHPNIKVFAFEDGGSGSASRPRNKGIELAGAPLISFLDPDNEISPGGYDTLCSLYHEAVESFGSVSFVSGYHVKVEERARTIGKHSAKRIHVVEDTKRAFLVSGKFPVVATQPAVIARQLFDNPTFRFVEKSAGQDTLFGWELLCEAERGVFTDSAYLIYYAQRSDSVTNVVDAGYFAKKLVLEKAQVSMLKRQGLLEVYLKHHYDRFMRDWYLPKLRIVTDPAEYERCNSILKEIADLYGRLSPQDEGIVGSA
ncbi:glycosyltransferase [Sinorhizobium meliloti]|uniref:glycosyltransferase n=1 Tax=Rhizobium meliloti TaxID=382 RepID=UPI00237F5CF9|nr:glycosyltransferase [Sinorhizobium meliloti]MDE3814322.1 glycosyltransferase [Sinorhizobium meliloti]